MSEVPAPSLAEQVEALLQRASADRIAEAREEGWRAGWMAGRAEANEEWRSRLRALLGDGPEATARPASPLLQHERPQPAAQEVPPADQPAPHATGTAAAQETKAQASTPALPAAAPAPPAPPVPARPYATPANPQDNWRTPERAVVFDREFLAGTDMTEIREIISAMPGPPVPKVNQPLWSWSVGRKLKRGAPPAASPFAPAPSLAAPRPPLYKVELPEPDPATGKVLATYGEIVAWAANHGLKYDGSNMDAVNRIRARLRQPLLLQDGP